MHRDTDRVYVGKTVQIFSRRWRCHVRAASTPLATHLERAIGVYSVDAFDYYAAEHHDTDAQAKQSERYWIVYHKQQGVVLFNQTEGGDGPAGGHKIQRGPLTAEHKAKLSVVGKGRPKSEEHRRKIGEGNIGNFASEQKIRKCREATLRIRADEEKGKAMRQNSEKLAESTRGKPACNRGVPPTDEARQNNRESQLRNAELRRQAQLTES